MTIEQLRILWNKAMSLDLQNLTSLQSSQSLTWITTLINRRNKPCTHVHPERRIPNVSDFRVEVNERYHPIFEFYGIKKRWWKPLLHIKRYSNRRLNRYIHHQFIRLNKLRSNPSAYWRIAEYLLNRSASYTTLLMFETFPGWHRKRKYRNVWKDICNLRRLRLDLYEYKNKTIPKNGGGTRTLGIPATHWRLYQHGLQVLLQIWLSPYCHPWQHGFVHGRGTDTAWRQIHDEVLDKAYIYEFDLKKFFDKVNLDYLQILLLRLRLPASLVSHIIRWNRTFASNSTGSVLSWDSECAEIHDYYYHVTGTAKRLSSDEYKLWLCKKRVSELRRPYLRRYDYFHGVSQGSPLSPLLSTLLLTYLLLLTPHCRVVQYADDGILYSSSPFDPSVVLHFPWESGIEINTTKSGWVRHGGVWLRDLKFLGKVYKGKDPTGPVNQGGSLHNSTRVPRDYTFTNYDMILQAAQYDWDYAIQNRKFPEDFDDWFSTKYFGYVTSGIYVGGLSITALQQDFKYRFETWSWSDLENQRKSNPLFGGLHYRLNGREVTSPFNVFNSSSYACLSLCQRIHHKCRRRAVTGFVM